MARQELLLTHAQECDRILGTMDQAHGRFDYISTLLDRQFSTIHNRAQVLLGTCGILISASVLLASVRIINAQLAHEHAAGALLVVAGVLEIGAAGILVTSVLDVRWMTQQPGADLRAWILSNLAYREKKSRAYRSSTILVLAGMLAYQCAVAIALLDL